MQYETRDFGTIEVSDGDMITFQQPMYGFEEYKKYALLFDEEIGGGIAWLQSLEEKGLCFLLLDPGALDIEYCPTLPPEVDTLLGGGDYQCWVVAVIRGGTESATANLKSPVLIKAATGMAMQLMLEQDYPVRYALAKEGQSPC